MAFSMAVTSLTLPLGKPRTHCGRNAPYNAETWPIGFYQGLDHPKTFVSNKQLCTFQASFLQIAQEGQPTLFVFFHAFRSPNHFPFASFIHRHGHQNSHIPVMSTPVARSDTRHPDKHKDIDLPKDLPPGFNLLIHLAVQSAYRPSTQFGIPE